MDLIDRSSPKKPWEMFVIALGYLANVCRGKSQTTKPTIKPHDPRFLRGVGGFLLHHEQFCSAAKMITSAEFPFSEAYPPLAGVSVQSFRLLF